MMHPLQRKQHLSLTSSWYREILCSFWDMQRDWDGKDLTSDVLGIGEQQAVANVSAKSEGVLAGMEEVVCMLERSDIVCRNALPDGTSVCMGDVVLTLSGRQDRIMKSERVLLNVLSRLSGIATLTQKVRACLPKHILLTPTRKTLWGPLDKKGVVIGGGGTHRLGLFDAVMVKENHLACLQEGISTARARIETAETCGAFWEIEVETEEEFISLWRNLPIQRPGLILLDNFQASDISRMLLGIVLPQGIYLEASGGITLSNIAEYGSTGVQSISMGLLTNASVPVDFSLRVSAV